MKSTKIEDRRQFLKNTSLAALSLGVLPSVAGAKNTKDIATNNALMCDKTTLDFYGEGPFYTENPPTIQNTQLANANETGTRLIISGRVFDLECDAYIPNAEIDVWHANDAGEYDNQGYNLRGKTTSNEQGFYVFETIVPGKYGNRPSHIHFKITAPGFSTLTTQLYFEGDPDLTTDPASSITSGEFDATHRIIPLTENSQGNFEGNWDIVINGDGITAVHDIHINKGVIYTASPSPFSSKLLIKYGVFHTAKTSLSVYDTQGRLVANLEEQNLSAEKYEAEWHPNNSIPNGHYFITLKINDLQVHYLKVILQR